jgi:hypothetical protein
MENEKIINEGDQAEIGKNSAITDPVMDEHINEADRTLSKKSNVRKTLLIIFRSLLIIICSILIIISLILFILYAVPVLKEISPRRKTEIVNNQELKKDALYKKQIGLVTKDIQRFSLKFNGYTSGQSYIVINTIENKFALYTKKKLIIEGFCS